MSVVVDSEGHVGNSHVVTGCSRGERGGVEVEVVGESASGNVDLENAFLGGAVVVVAVGVNWWVILKSPVSLSLATSSSEFQEVGGSLVGVWDVNPQFSVVGAS